MLEKGKMARVCFPRSGVSKVAKKMITMIVPPRSIKRMSCVRPTCSLKSRGDPPSGMLLIMFLSDLLAVTTVAFLKKTPHFLRRCKLLKRKHRCKLGGARLEDLSPCGALVPFLTKSENCSKARNKLQFSILSDKSARMSYRVIEVLAQVTVLGCQAARRCIATAMPVNSCSIVHS